MHYNDILQEYYNSTHGTEDGGDLDLKPLISCDYGKEEEFIKWAQNNLDCLEKENEARARNQLRNIQFYDGIHTLANSENVRAVDHDDQPVSMENRFVMNHILEFTLHKQARLLRYSPNINTFPWHNEYAARLGAKLGKKIIDSAFYVHDMDGMLADVSLEAAICGESFLFNEWDKYGGMTDEVVADAAAKLGLGATFTTEDGQTIALKEVAKVGDHCYKHPLPWHVRHQPRARWKDVDYIYYAEVVHIDELMYEHALNKKEKSEVEKQLKESEKDMQADYEKQGSYVIKWNFFHRKTKFVPKGFKARFCGKVLLEQGDLGFSHGELPCSRFTDYDDPRNAHGRSFYESLKLPSVMINNMMKVAYRSYVIAAYPKIVMQQDSCNMYAMANGPFVIEYAPGAKEPKIVSFNAVNQDFFPLSDHVERFMEKNSGTFGMSRGDNVPNARAGSILNFYEEQEQERESTQIRKINSFIEKTAKQTLTNFTKFAKAEDGRVLQVIGKNNMYKARKLSQEDFQRLGNEMSVKTQRTTALSESKQGRVDQITMLSNVPLAGEEKTGLFTREQILQMVEVADTPTFFEMATAAAERCMSEIEDLYEGKQIPDPQEHQAFLVDWNCYFQFMQSAEFCSVQGIPPEIQKEFKDRMCAIEMFLYEKAKFNLALAEVLAKNKYFPSVFRIPPTDLPLSQIVLVLSNLPVVPMPQSPGGEMPGQTAAESTGAAKGIAGPDDAPPSDVPEEIPAEEEAPDALPGDEAVM